jgi:hypothetical protein
MAARGRVIHCRDLIWVLQVVGSNPAAPTIFVAIGIVIRDARRSLAGRFRYDEKPEQPESLGVS